MQYKTRKGKAGGVVVAIYLPAEHSPRQHWRGFWFCENGIATLNLCLHPTDARDPKLGTIRQSTLFLH